MLSSCGQLCNQSLIATYHMCQESDNADAPACLQPPASTSPALRPLNQRRQAPTMSTREKVVILYSTRRHANFFLTSFDAEGPFHAAFGPTPPQATHQLNLYSSLVSALLEKYRLQALPLLHPPDPSKVSSQTVKAAFREYRASAKAVGYDVYQPARCIVEGYFKRVLGLERAEVLDLPESQQGTPGDAEEVLVEVGGTV